MPTLTAAQLNVLQAHADAGDRIAYYSALASCGFEYGALALGVVLNNTIAGATANIYFEDTASDMNGATLSRDQLAELSTALMRADFDARQNNGGADISGSNIQDYHREVFLDFGVSADAWTPNIYLDSFATEAEKEAAWQGMLASTSVGTFADIATHFAWATEGSFEFDYLVRLTNAGTSAQIAGSGDYGNYSISTGSGQHLEGGTASGNSISGTTGNDVIIAFGGNDTISGSAGNDRLYGGDGNDALTFAQLENAVTIRIGSFHSSAAQSLWSPVSITNVVEIETSESTWTVAVGFETLVGSNQDDVLAISGTIEGLRTAHEMLFDGLDGSGSGIWGDTIDLRSVTGTNGCIVTLDYDNCYIVEDGQILGAQGIYVLNFENVIGTFRNDTITGNDLANILNGKGGGDRLDGGGGDDILVFDQDDTFVFGGEGYDTGIFRGPGSLNGFNMNEHGLEVLVASAASDTIYLGGSDQVQMVAGGSGDDVFYIDASGDMPVVVWGGSGADKYVVTSAGTIGILAVTVSNITAENFQYLTLSDINVGEGFDWSEIDIVVLNPDSGDRIYNEYIDEDQMVSGYSETFSFEGETPYTINYQSLHSTTQLGGSVQYVYSESLSPAVNLGWVTVLSDPHFYVDGVEDDSFNPEYLAEAELSISANNPDIPPFAAATSSGEVTYWSVDVGLEVRVTETIFSYYYYYSDVIQDYVYVDSPLTTPEDNLNSVPFFIAGGTFEYDDDDPRNYQDSEYETFYKPILQANGQIAATIDVPDSAGDWLLTA